MNSKQRAKARKTLSFLAGMARMLPEGGIVSMLISAVADALSDKDPEAVLADLRANPPRMAPTQADIERMARGEPRGGDE